MSAKYDYLLAKKTIQKYSDLLEEASLGMAEDWFWTAGTVYADGTFVINLEEKELKIAGIDSSPWATPTLSLLFKDGSEKLLPCHTGESDICKRPEWLELGCLSGPCQDETDKKLGKYLN